MNPKIVSKRSFLIANVENILENLSSRRESKKNDADDLFGIQDDNSAGTIQHWTKTAPDKTELELLMMEKEILGLYVSGNPLAQFKSLERKVRNLTGEHDIHLVLIEKIKKVFTRANKMMLATQITTTDEEMEGLVFPKLAMGLSSILVDKQIFWVKGNVKEPEQKKKEIAEVAEPSEEPISETKEFVERKKLIFEDAIAFESGIIPLIERLKIQLTIHEREELENLDWVKMIESPGQILYKNTNNSNSNNGEIQKVFQLKLHKNLGMTKVKEIRSHLQKSNPTNNQNLIQVEVYVEVKDEWKKVSGQNWLDQDYLQTLEF